MNMTQHASRMTLAALAACALAVPGASARAAAPELTYGIGLQAGTLGIGPDLNIGVNRHLGFDLGLNTYDRTYSGSQSGIDYHFKAKLSSVHLLANVYPFGGVFHLTTGVVSNGNKFDLNGTPGGNGYTINGTTYTAAEVGTLDGKISFPGTAYYLGLGWGLAYAPGSRWGFNFDLGGLYQGKPKFALTSSGGTYSNDATFQQNLREQQAKTQRDIKDYQWWPVARFGVYLKF